MDNKLEVNHSEKFVVLSISGGIGKNILATALVKGLKKKFNDRKIIILTAWKDVWLYNPDVFRSYNFQSASYFYDSFIKDKDVRIFALEPYQTESYILKKEHLLESWFTLCGLTYEDEKPELFFNQREVEYVKNNIVKNDPILLIQTHGGGQSEMKHSWMRDMPLETAYEIIQNFKGSMRIIHIRRPDQLPLPDTEVFEGTIRELFVLIRFSLHRVFIDSMCQHAAAALDKKSTVLWIRNHPLVLGHPIHDNIVTDAPNDLETCDFSLLEAFDISGQIQQCPFKEGTKLFDSKEIIESILQQ
jgi:hypothetical protein